MGTGCNLESLLTGLDSLSDRFSNSSYSLQVGTLGVRGVRPLLREAQPQDWVPTPRLPCWPPKAGFLQCLLREAIYQGIHVTLPLLFSWISRPFHQIPFLQATPGIMPV